MPKNIDLPMDSKESARVTERAASYKALRGGGYGGATEESIVRMIFDGGLLKKKEGRIATALADTAPLASRAVMALDSSVAELLELEARWVLSHEETLRIIVVDGLAYVEEALLAFGQGHNVVPEKKGSA